MFCGKSHEKAGVSQLFFIIYRFVFHVANFEYCNVIDKRFSSQVHICNRGYRLRRVIYSERRARSNFPCTPSNAMDVFRDIASWTQNLSSGFLKSLFELRTHFYTHIIERRT